MILLAASGHYHKASLLSTVPHSHTQLMGTIHDSETLFIRGNGSIEVGPKCHLAKTYGRHKGSVFAKLAELREGRHRGWR